MVLETIQGQLEFTCIANLYFEQGSTLVNTGQHWCPPDLHADEVNLQLEVSKAVKTLTSSTEKLGLQLSLA